MKKKWVYILIAALLLPGASGGGYYLYQRHQAHSLYGQAQKAYQQKDYRQAVTLYQKLLLLVHENRSRSTDDLAEICLYFGHAYYKIEPDDDGNGCLTPILLLYKTSNINDITVRAYISFWLGRFSSNQKKWAESSQNYQIAIKNLTQMYTFKNFDKQLSEPLLCESYRELLKSYFELKQYSKAENIVSEIENLQLENTKNPEWAGVYSGLAANARAAKNLEKAMIYCEKGLKICESLPETPESQSIRGAIMWTKARILYKKNELSQAIRLGRQAHDILKQGIYGSIAPEVLKTVEAWEK